MEFYSNNPIADAQDHIRFMDSIPHDFDHLCDCCKEGFDHHHGVQMQDEKFCNECVANNEHIEFYRQNGLTAFDIYEVTNKSTDL